LGSNDLGSVTGLGGGFGTVAKNLNYLINIL